MNDEWYDLVRDSNGYVLLAVSSNGWVTEEHKAQWFIYCVKHPDFPHPERKKLYQVDGHFTNHSAELQLAVSCRQSGGLDINQVDRDLILARVRKALRHCSDGEGARLNPRAAPFIPACESVAEPLAATATTRPLCPLAAPFTPTSASSATATELPVATLTRPSHTSITSNATGITPRTLVLASVPAQTTPTATAPTATTDRPRLRALATTTTETTSIGPAASATSAATATAASTPTTTTTATAAGGAARKAPAEENERDGDSAAARSAEAAARDAQAKEMEAIVAECLGKPVEGDNLSIIPAHTSHGTQAADVDGGTVATLKNNCNKLVPHEYAANGFKPLSKAQLVGIIYKANTGCSYRPTNEEEEVILPGITEDVIKRSQEKVGWFEDERTRELKYRPLDVIDERKFLDEKPGDDLHALNRLGPTEAAPVAFLVRTRGGPAKPVYARNDALVAGCEYAVRSVLTAKQRSLFDKKVASDEEQQKKRAERNATASRLYCPSGRMASLGQVLISAAAKEQEAVEAEAKRKATADRKEEQLAAAREAVGPLLAESKNADDFKPILFKDDVTVPQLKGLCRLLDLQVGGKKAQLQQRISDKLPSLRRNVTRVAPPVVGEDNSVSGLSSAAAPQV